MHLRSPYVTCTMMRVGEKNRRRQQQKKRKKREHSCYIKIILDYTRSGSHPRKKFLCVKEGYASKCPCINPNPNLNLANSYPNLS